MGTEKRSTEERQLELTKAVLDIIATQGLRKLSVARVARRVGLVPSAIYRHFRSKEDMLDASLDFIEKRLHQNLREVCQETADPLERLRLLLMRHAQLIRENQAIPKLIFSEDVHNVHPERKARLRRIVLGYLHRIAEIFRDGQAEGKIALAADPATLSIVLLGLFQPAGILWYLSDGNFDVTRHVEKAWFIFSQMIRKPDRRRVRSKRRRS